METKHFAPIDIKTNSLSGYNNLKVDYDNWAENASKKIYEVIDKINANEERERKLARENIEDAGKILLYEEAKKKVEDDLRYRDSVLPTLNSLGIDSNFIYSSNDRDFANKISILRNEMSNKGISAFDQEKAISSIQEIRNASYGKEKERYERNKTKAETDFDIRKAQKGISLLNAEKELGKQGLTLNTITDLSEEDIEDIVNKVSPIVGRENADSIIYNYIKNTIVQDDNKNTQDQQITYSEDTATVAPSDISQESTPALPQTSSQFKNRVNNLVSYGDVANKTYFRNEDGTYTLIVGATKQNINNSKFGNIIDPSGKKSYKSQAISNLGQGINIDLSKVTNVIDLDKNEIFNSSMPEVPTYKQFLSNANNSIVVPTLNALFFGKEEDNGFGLKPEDLQDKKNMNQMVLYNILSADPKMLEKATTSKQFREALKDLSKKIEDNALPQDKIIDILKDHGIENDASLEKQFYVLGKQIVAGKGSLKKREANLASFQKFGIKDDLTGGIIGTPVPLLDEKAFNEVEAERQKFLYTDSSIENLKKSLNSVEEGSKLSAESLSDFSKESVSKLEVPKDIRESIRRSKYNPMRFPKGNFIHVTPDSPEEAIMYGLEAENILKNEGAELRPNESRTLEVYKTLGELVRVQKENNAKEISFKKNNFMADFQSPEKLIKNYGVPDPGKEFLDIVEGLNKYKTRGELNELLPKLKFHLETNPNAAKFLNESERLYSILKDFIISAQEQVPMFYVPYHSRAYYIANPSDTGSTK